MNRCLAEERSLLPYLSFNRRGTVLGDGNLGQLLAGYDLDALAVDAHGQNFGASQAD